MSNRNSISKIIYFFISFLFVFQYYYLACYIVLDREIFFLLSLQACVNIPCTSKATQHRKDQKSLFTSKTDVQVVVTFVYICYFVYFAYPPGLFRNNFLDDVF